MISDFGISATDISISSVLNSSENNEISYLNIDGKILSIDNIKNMYLYYKCRLDFLTAPEQKRAIKAKDKIVLIYSFFILAHLTLFMIFLYKTPNGLESQNMIIIPSIMSTIFNLVTITMIERNYHINICRKIYILAYTTISVNILLLFSILVFSIVIDSIVFYTHLNGAITNLLLIINIYSETIKMKREDISLFHLINRI